MKKKKWEERKEKNQAMCLDCNRSFCNVHRDNVRNKKSNRNDEDKKEQNKTKCIHTHRIEA